MTANIGFIGAGLPQHAASSQEHGNIWPQIYPCSVLGPDIYIYSFKVLHKTLYV